MNASEIVCILLLEDSPLDLFLIRAAFSRLAFTNFEIMESDHLSKALALLQEKSFDAVLADLNLPDSFGTETVRALVRESGGVPIWVLTGDNDPRIPQQLLEEGAWGCICKDHLEPPTLQLVLDAAIQHRHAVS